MADQAPAMSMTAMAVAVGLVCLTAGYFLGQGSSIGLFDATTGKSQQSKSSWPNNYDVNVHVETSDSELDEVRESYTKRQKKPHEMGSEEETDEDLPSHSTNNFSDNIEEVKLVLAVRTDLGMTKGTIPARNRLFILTSVGKIAAQCGHATLACYKSLAGTPPFVGLLKRWEKNGQPKIALQCKSEEDLEMLQAKAMSFGLVARIIHDAGRTQIATGSATVLGIVGPKSVVDQVTGHLKLL